MYYSDVNNEMRHVTIYFELFSYSVSQHSTIILIAGIYKISKYMNTTAHHADLNIIRKKNNERYYYYDYYDYLYYYYVPISSPIFSTH